MKFAVVTGTSKGLGLNIAKHLIANGWFVYGLARGDQYETLYNYKHFNVDISNKESVEQCISELGVIDLLINNAAVFDMNRFDEINSSMIDHIIDTNVKGTMFVTRSCLKNMSIGSKIIFINSVSGLEEIGHQALYCASKTALTAFAGVLGKELQTRNIKVVSLHPGGINTTLWSNNQYPGGNVNNTLDPDEVSKMILFVVNSSTNIQFKTIKMFPDNEWHS